MNISAHPHRAKLCGEIIRLSGCLLILPPIIGGAHYGWAVIGAVLIAAGFFAARTGNPARPISQRGQGVWAMVYLALALFALIALGVTLAVRYLP